MSHPANRQRTGVKGSLKRKAAGKMASRSTASARGGAQKRRSAGAPARELWKVVKVGFHFGNWRTTVAASKNGDRLQLKKDVFTNVVGFLKLGASFSRMRDSRDVLFADDAFRFIRQVDFKRPIRSGLVVDVKVCRQFISHVCSAVDPAGAGRLWGVASIPVPAGPEEWERARRGLSGILERLVLVPEPYLAAEGMHLEKAVRARGILQDLTRHSLVVDIGATTTDLCLVRGELPKVEDQIRLDKAGDSIDDRILRNSLIRYPTLCLTQRMAREIKEEQAFVGGQHVGLEAPMPGGSELLAFVEVLHRACEDLLQAVAEASCELLGRCPSESAAAVSRNIILTGGGSQIRNFAPALERLLRERGHTEASVLVPEDCQRLVARGALRFAEKLSEEEWEALASRKPAEEVISFGKGSPPAAPPEAGEAAAASAPEEPGKDFQDVVIAAPAPEPGREPALARPDPAPVSKENDFTIEDLEELELFKAL